MSLRVVAALALLVAVGDSLPIVDPGLFVIMGVRTCGDGNGYCLLGSDCTLDDDFVPDQLGGHCDGLRNAFTPSAPFICCRYNAKPGNASTTAKPKPTDASEVSTSITTLSPASTTIDTSTATTTTTSTTSSDAEQDWSPISGSFPVFGQDVKEVELDVSIPVGYRPVASSTTSGVVEELGPADPMTTDNGSGSEDTSGSDTMVSSSEVSSASTKTSDPGIILVLEDESAVDPATRERWLLGRLKNRQEIGRLEAGQ